MENISFRKHMKKERKLLKKMYLDRNKKENYLLTFI